MSIISILTKLFGFNSEQSLTNKIGGIINYSWFIPFIGWSYLHRFDSVNIYVQIVQNQKTETYQVLQTSMGFLTLVFLGLLVYFEILRRSRNINPNPT